MSSASAAGSQLLTTELATKTKFHIARFSTSTSPNFKVDTVTKMYKEEKEEPEEEEEEANGQANRWKQKHFYGRKKKRDPAEEYRMQPWIIDVPDEKKSYKGGLTTPGTDNVKTAYVLFVKEAGRISVRPTADWYTFRMLPRVKALSMEEAETKIRDQEKAAEKLVKREARLRGGEQEIAIKADPDEPTKHGFKEEVDFDDYQDDDGADDVVQYYDDDPTKRYLTDEGKVIKDELRKDEEISPEELDLLPEGEDIAAHVAGAKSKRKALAPPPVEIETKKMRTRAVARDITLDEESVAWVIHRKGSCKLVKLMQKFKELLVDDAAKKKFANIVKRISTKIEVQEGEKKVSCFELTEKYKAKYSDI